MNPEPTPRAADPFQADLFRGPGAGSGAGHTTGPAFARAEAGPEAPNYWDYCPNCSARLFNVGCKYRCSRCHYFMSCSDFD